MCVITNYSEMHQGDKRAQQKVTATQPDGSDTAVTQKTSYDPRQ